MSLTTVYRAADGREFPVEWADAEEASHTWSFDAEHNPTPMTPLDYDAWQLARAGASRARVEAGFPDWSFFGPSKWVHGFSYYRDWDMPASVGKELARASVRRLEEYGSQAGFWNGYCLPRIQETVDSLKAATGQEPVERYCELYGFGMEHTFIFIEDGSALRKLCESAFGEEGDRIAVELTQGFPSATIEADQALWELAELARKSPALASAIRDGAATVAAIEGLEGGQAFAAAFDTYMDTYGWRSLDWDPFSPTWRDRPETAFAVIRRTLVEGSPAPLETMRQTRQRREAVLAAALERLAGEPERQEELRSHAAKTERYLEVKEGRALWQLTMNGVLRHALLKKGSILVANGSLRAPEDISFLKADEVDVIAGKDVSALVAERRAERERWWGVIPPGKIGGIKEGEAPAADDASEAAEIKGIAASRGKVTARARVLKSVDEFDRLGAGEVLVCVTTTPTWTPLFAVAGALVTDGGGLLSHPAIAAREYGIPAVVGSRVATRAIRDGALVTVDGDAGTVRVED